MNLSKYCYLLVYTTLMVSFKSFALVDYSEPVAVPEKKSAAKNASTIETSKASTSLPSDVGSGPSFSFTKAFSDLFGNLKFASTVGVGAKVDELPDLAKYNKYTFDVRVESNFHFFFQGKYWIGEAKRFEDQSFNQQSQRGNAELLLGFNFLKIGSSSDLATLDLWAGMDLPSSSLLAHSRKDQLFGVELSKRFRIMGFGLSYEYRKAGNPERLSELMPGNMQMTKVTLGWIMTSDIQFHTDYSYYAIAENRQNNRQFEKVTFSKLAPKFVLNLYPAMDLSLGGEFMVKRVEANKFQQLLAAKYFKTSPYGTSLFSELTFHF